MPDLLAFSAVAIVVIATPGQDTALTVRNTLTGGRQAGLRTAAGVVCGQAVWALAASAGVAALLVAWEPAFVALNSRAPRTSSTSAAARSSPPCGGGTSSNMGPPPHRAGVPGASGC